MRMTLGQAAEVRLGRQRAPQFEHGDHVVPYLRSANVQDGRLELSDVKQMNFTLAEQAIFGLAPGDVLVTEGSGSRETVGVSAVWRSDMDGPVCFQNTLLRLRPRPGLTDGRYLAWWARHVRTSGQIAAVSSGANILHLGSDGLKALPIVLPDLHAQRRTADFLDDRVARIDQIITTRRRQMSLYGERLSLLIDEIAGGQSCERMTRLGRLARIQSGLTIDAGRTTDIKAEAHPYLRVANVQAGRLDLTEVKNVMIDPVTARRVTLQVGDVLMTEGGDLDKLGRGTVWHGQIANCLHQNHVFAVRCDRALLEPHFLALYTRTSVARKYFESTGVRSTNLASTSSAKVAALPLPLRGVVDQERAVASFTRWSQGHDAAEAGLLRSVELLQDYKQSLITAAVTGELDVTTASTRIPE